MKRLLNFRSAYLKVLEVLKNIDSQEVRNDFKLLADANLVVDVNGLRELSETHKLARLFPSLKIVIEHISGPGKDPQLLRKTATLPNVYGKVSHILKRKNNQPLMDVEFYKESLDSLWRMFGPEKLMYGSNWPVSDKYNGTYEQIFSLIDNYTDSLSLNDKRMFLGRNAQRIYFC